MTCSEGRWTCPVCLTTIVRPATVKPDAWAATVRRNQQVHGEWHTQTVPAETAREAA